VLEEAPSRGAAHRQLVATRAARLARVLEGLDEALGITAAA
jgi:hypothetical protein